MRLLSHPWLHRFLGLVLGAVFVYASLDKISQPAAFARIVYHYQIVGPSQSLSPLVPNLVAVTLPWVELLTGLALMAGVWRREAALLTAVLLVVFLGAVGSILYRGIDVENCGCFSLAEGGRQAGWTLLAGDAALLLGAVVLAAVVPRRDDAPPAAEAVPTR